MTIAETLDLWRTELSRLGRSPEHVERSVRFVQELADHAGATDPAAVRPIDVLRWLGSRRWSGKSQRNRASAVRSWGAFLELLELGRNPARSVRTPRETSGTGADPMTLEQLLRLLDAAETREASQDRRRSRRGPLCSTVYLVAVSTALRRGELAGQRWADVDLFGRSLVVTADKSRRRDELPIGPELAARLHEWRRWSDGELVFPEFPSDHTLRRDLQAAGVSGSGLWHRLRKTAITLRAQRWSDYRELVRFARHRDATTTLRSYDRIRTDELRPIAEAIPELWTVRSRSDPGPMEILDGFPIAKSFGCR